MIISSEKKVRDFLINRANSTPLSRVEVHQATKVSISSLCRYMDRLEKKNLITRVGKQKCATSGKVCIHFKAIL